MPRMAGKALIGTCGFLAAAVFMISGSFEGEAGSAQCRKDGVITIGTGSDVSSGSYRGDLVKEWNETKSEGSPSVELVEISDLTDVERAEMAASVQARRCAYDIVLLDVAWMPEFAKHGYLREIRLSEAQKAAFVPKVLSTGQVDGKQFGVPFVTDTPLLFYKTGLPLPDTMDHFMEYAKRHGYAAQFADYEGGTVNILEAILSEGARIVDGDRVVLAEPGNAEKAGRAIAKWKAMASREPAGRPMATNLREESSFMAFRSHEVGYMRNWPFSFFRLASGSSMRRDDGSLGFRMAPFPGKGILGGFNLAVVADSPYADQAMKLIEFLTSPDAQTRLFACGAYPPVLESVYQTYRRQPVTCDRGRAENPKWEITGEQLADFAEAIHTGLRTAEIRPPAASYSAFSELFRRCTRPAILGQSEIDFGTFAAALQDAMVGRRTAEDPCDARS
ncbi:extracellular solute-binding protein [Herbidospora sp. RD11066]